MRAGLTHQVFNGRSFASIRPVWRLRECDSSYPHSRHDPRGGFCGERTMSRDEARRPERVQSDQKNANPAPSRHFDWPATWRYIRGTPRRLYERRPTRKSAIAATVVFMLLFVLPGTAVYVTSGASERSRIAEAHAALTQADWKALFQRLADYIYKPPALAGVYV